MQSKMVWEAKMGKNTTKGKNWSKWEKLTSGNNRTWKNENQSKAYETVNHCHHTLHTGHQHQLFHALACIVTTPYTQGINTSFSMHWPALSPHPTHKTSTPAFPCIGLLLLLLIINSWTSTHCLACSQAQHKHDQVYKSSPIRGKQACPEGVNAPLSRSRSSTRTQLMQHTFKNQLSSIIDQWASMQNLYCGPTAETKWKSEQGEGKTRMTTYLHTQIPPDRLCGSHIT